MIANKLMIGDWVHLHNVDEEYLTITEIREEKIYAEGLDGRIDPYCYDAIEPVPLTAEILEKNGWTVLHGEYAEGICSLAIGKDEICWYEGQLLIKRHYSNENRNIINLHGITHIHELQHALRLAGIEKEVTL